MKIDIHDFISHLLVYDYILFGGVIILFLIFIILAIAFHQKQIFAIIMVLFAFITLTVGPIAGYMNLHRYLFKHKTTITDVKALEFTEALLIKGDINNTSKRSFKECTLHAGVYKVTHNRYLDPIYRYIPFKKTNMRIPMEIKSGENGSFKLFIEPFRYKNDYNITLNTECR